MVVDLGSISADLARAYKGLRDKGAVLTEEEFFTLATKINNYRSYRTSGGTVPEGPYYWIQRRRCTVETLRKGKADIERNKLPISQFQLDANRVYSILLDIYPKSDPKWRFAETRLLALPNP